MPNYEGNLNRSLTFALEEDAEKIFASIMENKNYVPNQYLSATKKGVYNDEGQIQLYIQNSKKGKNLGSLNDMEHEVLYPRNSSFKVLNGIKQDGKYYILLEEE